MVTSGLYPNEQVIEIFGERVKWPGLGPDGKFTNGSFSDPLVKPSFIPAETLNLLLDNMQRVIEEAGLEPNNIEPDQLLRALQALKGSGGVGTNAVSSHDSMAEGMGRDLMEVELGHGIGEMTTQSLRDEAIAETTYKLHCRLNNDGQIDGSGIPDPRGLLIGDWLDGIDLSGCAAPTNGTAPQAWNDTYKNNRIVVSGFNTYKGAGDTENDKNHILFTFRNCVAKGRMNATDTNANGYKATELRTWIDGANGNGSGALATKLKAALGGNYLYTIRRQLSTKNQGWDWQNYTLFLLSEDEILGSAHWSEANYGNGLNVHIPLYQKSTVYRVKRFNGLRHWYWYCDPTAPYSTSFVWGYGGGFGHGGNSSYIEGGISPAFCVC